MFRLLFLAKLSRAVLAVLGLAFVWLLVMDGEVRGRVLDLLKGNKRSGVSRTIRDLEKKGAETKKRVREAREAFGEAEEMAEEAIKGARKGIKKAKGL